MEPEQPTFDAPAPQPESLCDMGPVTNVPSHAGESTGRGQRTDAVQALLCEEPEESNWKVGENGGGVRAPGELAFSGDRVSVWGAKTVLERSGGDGRMA